MFVLVSLLAPPPLTVGEPIPVPVLKGVVTLPDGALLGANRLGKTLVIRRSGDGGRMWRDLAIAARTERPDFGDGNLVRMRDGTLALCYRDNAPPRDNAPGEYAIRVVRSRDDGKSWTSPETVDSRNRGLWAPFLLPLRDGGLLVFYDDEDWPARQGRAGHQWITSRRWNPRERSWSQPVLASRKPGTDLARDGMHVAVETSPGRILGAVEDVADRDPRPSGIYRTLSVDGGRTWAWSRGDRPALFTGTWPHMAVSPALLRLPDGRLLAAFCTDEALPKASRSGTPPHRMPLETWGSLSRDAGRTWSPAFPLHRGTARDYLPALSPRKGGAWLNVLDFDRGPLLIPLSIPPETEK